MKVYKVIKGCSVSYRNENNIDVGFALYNDDIIFIENCWITSGIIHGGNVSPAEMLVKIFYNKASLERDSNGELITKYKWTWIENINIVDPFINGKKITNSTYLEDVTTFWNRDEKLSKLLE